MAIRSQMFKKLTGMRGELFNHSLAALRCQKGKMESANSMAKFKREMWKDYENIS